MKKNIVGLLGLALLLFLGYGTVVAQSMPVIGSTMPSTVISQAYTQAQCLEPGNVIVYVTRQFYLGDTYTTTDVVPKWGGGYDTLLLNASKVLVHNPALFNFTAPITYKSNGIPNNAPVTSMVSAQGTFIVSSTNPGQLVYNIHRTALENAGSSSYSLAYLGRPNLVNYTAQLNGKTFHSGYPWVRDGYECVNYIVHYCGDGVVDTQQTIASLEGGITTSIANEQCDGTAGVPAGYTCTPTCTLQTIVVKPTCTLSVSSGSIALGSSAQASWTINGNYTNTPQITYTPTTRNITGLPYTVTSPYGQRTITPQHTGSYLLSMTVSNSAGSSVCTAPIVVNPPPQQLQCTLSVSPNPVFVNQVVSVGWNVMGGNFFGTYMYVNPSIAGAWPHWINANQYSGVTSAMPTQVGDYTFTLMVSNNQSSATCTGVLHVIANTPPTCSLTTSTPTITSGQNAILNGSYTNATVASMTPNIAGLNFTYPTRSNSAISVHPTTTTTYTMVVTGQAGTTPAICPVTINVAGTPQLSLTKTLVNNILYHSGDLVSFRIDFANIGNVTAHHVILSDYLPAALTYESSQLYGVNPPYTFGTGMNGNNILVEYSGFTLIPGQQGYMIITGKFKGYQRSNQTLNNVFLDSDETNILHASALFYTYTPSANAVITKTVNKSTYYPGEDARFTIAVTNNGPDTIQNVQLIDTWPNSSCIIADTLWTSNVPMTMINSTNPYKWNLNNPLSVGQTAYLYLTGHIANNPNCIGSYTNIVDLRYTVNGQLKTGQANVTINVIGLPNASMTIQKNILTYGTNAGDPIKYELIYTNNGTTAITSYTVTDYWPGTLNFVGATPQPNSQTPTPGGLLLRWLFTTPIAPNGTGRIVLNGTIK